MKLCAQHSDMALGALLFEVDIEVVQRISVYSVIV